MTQIRSLDIRKNVPDDPALVPAKSKPAVWLLDVPPERRLALHIAETTQLRQRPEKLRRRSKLWWWVAALYLLLPAAAVTVGVSLWMLRRIAT